MTRGIPALAAPTLLLLLVLVPTGAPAQITGVVRNHDGAALSNVTVEAWGEGQRLSMRVTDEDGRFAFPVGVASRTRSLYARRLGLRAVRVPVEEGTRHYELHMAEEPLTIEGVTVDAGGDFCEAGSDGRARELWEDARARYAHDVDTLGLATYLASREESVTLDGIRPLKLPEVGYEQRGSSSLLRFSWRRWIDRNGYARSIRKDGPLGAYPSWVYPPLEADFAPHFVDRLFGDLHEFHLLDRTDDGWVLGFCPEDPDEDEARIRGRLSIKPDSTLAWAEWRFVTPEPDEDAGGRAVFEGVRPGERAFLLPVEGLFWRRQPGGRYLLTHERYEGWLVSQGDSVPFLPVRRPAG